MQLAYDMPIAQLICTNFSTEFTITTVINTIQGTTVIGPTNFNNIPIRPVNPRAACITPANMRLPDN